VLDKRRVSRRCGEDAIYQLGKVNDARSEKVVTTRDGNDTKEGDR
jgi:hypothetical protein